MYYGTRAVVVKSTDYRDADKLVTLFSEKEGKVKAIAKGVKKPGSSLRICVQPFAHSFLYLSRGGELDLITQGRIMDFYADIRENLGKTLYIAYVMELLDKSLLERVPMPFLYKDVLEVLEYIETRGLNFIVIRYFEMRLLIELGYKPELDVCVNCGQKFPVMNMFSLSGGGVLCEKCSEIIKPDFVLSGEALSLLKFLAKSNIRTLERLKASEGALNKIERILEKYLEYYIERKFNTKYIISDLKKSLPLTFDKG
ncbi:DNA repair protein RecO [Thermosyntropha sp.]|uniref:DNA repair protein RecO n=1 Tax=Thermosyntropha sp. TaxID=2740820 RepID=UPI0025CC8103|nr:DNA repair protein RecO [Thermosyntropha sp.]MBO8158668.1 DNA repair protein RecO [Thermosyntropha sp.]